MLNVRHFWRTAGTLVFTFGLGSVGSLFFWLLYLCGFIRVRGYRKLFTAVSKGNLIIASNHPTLLEVVLIPAMLGPWMLFRPKRFFVWSAPDVALFPEKLRWLYEITHCIKVDRKNRYIQLSARQIIRTLRSGASVVIHPEGGRTDSPPRGKNGTAVTIVRLGTREIRELNNSRITDIALKTSAHIIPIWIDVPFRKVENGFLKAWWVWISQYHTITFNVGDSYLANPKQTTRERNEELTEKILSS